MWKRLKQWWYWKQRRNVDYEYLNKNEFRKRYDHLIIESYQHTNDSPVVIMCREKNHKYSTGRIIIHYVNTDVAKIGCITKTLQEWDYYFSTRSKETFETPRNTRKWRKLKRQYLFFREFLKDNNYD